MTDLLVMPIAALMQQKLRTMLTILGVVFGAFVLTASLSIGEGVQETIDRESRKNNISRKVTVYPRWKIIDSNIPPEVVVGGTMSPERRERLRKALVGQNRSVNPTRVFLELSRERLKTLAELPHVAQVIPIIGDSGLALLGNKPESTTIHSGDSDDENFLKRIIAGRGFDTADQRGVLVSELLLYRMGLENDFDLQQLIGKPLRLEIRGQQAEPGFAISIQKGSKVTNKDEQLALQQLASQLPAALDKLDLFDPEIEVLRKAIQPGPEPVTEADVHSEDFPVVGVYRQATEDEMKESRSSFQADSGLILPQQTALDFFFKERDRRKVGVDQAVLLVDNEKNVKEVARLVGDLGLESRAAIEFIERERLTYILIFGGMTCVAGVALLVSSLGIANTMLMSVLERKREIGIMKAVGADNRHLLFIFIVEGGLIGLAGATFGLLLAWAASFPGDAWVRSMVMRDMKIDLKGSIFVFPTWIGVTVVFFTVLVTTVAAFYPARHAARVDPVSALRHE